MQLLLKKYYLFQTLLWGFFFVSTAYFNRFAADDFYFINEIKAKSSYDIFYHLQFNWNGRYFSNAILAWCIQWGSSPSFLMIFNLISILLLYLSINRLVNKVVLLYNINLKQRSFIAFIILSVFFFTSKAVNDVWFWYSGAAIYLSTTIALFLLLSVLITPKKTPVDFMILIMASTAIPGANEAMAIILILFFIFWLVVIKPKNKLPILLALTIMLIGFFINYSGNGTAYRDKITPSLNAMDVVLYTGYATVKTLFFQFHKTFLPALILALPLIFLRIKIKDKERFNPIKEFIFSSILISGVVFINHLIAVIPLGALSPERITIVSSVLILILLLRYLILLGNKITISEKAKKVILLTNTIGMLIFVVVMFNRHKNYAEAYDARMEKLIKLKKTVSHQDPIYLEPLPVSGYIPTAEITTDTTHFLNVDLKNHFNLKNDLILRK